MLARKAAVIVDIDSTLCDTTHRHHLSPYADPSKTWEEYGQNCEFDAPIRGTVELVKLLGTAYNIRIVSGRPQTLLAPTRRWLRKHQIAYSSVHLRSPDEPVGNAEYKKYYLDIVRTSEAVALAIDDWPSVVEMYHAEGVPCVCINPMYNDEPMKFFDLNNTAR